MHIPIRVADDIYWIGSNDNETALFEQTWPLPQGITYNTYIICDEKVAVIDTIKELYVSSFIEKIRHLLKEGKSVDYLIINHMEPDHSGSISILAQLFPNMKIVGNKKTLEFVKGFYNITENTYEVGDGDVLDLGKHKLKFYITPMVHWPETMVTVDETTKTMFSCDAFGGFGTLDGGIFDDEVNLEFYEDEILRYYSNIVGRYSQMVQRALAKLKDVPVAVIAPSHGPIWRKNPAHIVAMYDKWSRLETEKGVVIAYGSMYGNTRKMAESIARSIAEEGVENIRLFNVSHTHISYIIRDAWKFKGFILGSCTYDQGIYPMVKHLMTAIDNKKLIENHVFGVFGSYSWSGGAVSAIKEFAQNMKWKLVEPVIEAKFAPGYDHIDQCVALGKNIVKAL